MMSRHRCPGERGDAGPALGSRTDASDAPSEQLALQRSVQHLSKQVKQLQAERLRRARDEGIAHCAHHALGDVL
ncbi:hypothetical protein WJX84_006652 [Apatococcus fuscideae]|uniref:Uncharacterized protein n=1 Tax=Apatococcus fuscideae TaxID=2026836 RepID=A0AAW1SWV2_9CHLO